MTDNYNIRINMTKIIVVVIIIILHKILTLRIHCQLACRVTINMCYLPLTLSYLCPTYLIIMTGSEQFQLASEWNLNLN